MGDGIERTRKPVVEVTINFLNKVDEGEWQASSKIQQKHKAKAAVTNFMSNNSVPNIN